MWPKCYSTKLSEPAMQWAITRKHSVWWAIGPRALRQWSRCWASRSQGARTRGRDSSVKSHACKSTHSASASFWSFCNARSALLVGCLDGTCTERNRIRHKKSTCSVERRPEPPAGYVCYLAIDYRCTVVRLFGSFLLLLLLRDLIRAVVPDLEVLVVLVVGHHAAKSNV